MLKVREGPLSAGEVPDRDFDWVRRCLLACPAPPTTPPRFDHASPYPRPFNSAPMRHLHQLLLCRLWHLWHRRLRQPLHRRRRQDQFPRQLCAGARRHSAVLGGGEVERDASPQPYPVALPRSNKRNTSDAVHAWGWLAAEALRADLFRVVFRIILSTTLILY